jgi:integrase
MNRHEIRVRGVLVPTSPRSHRHGLRAAEVCDLRGIKSTSMARSCTSEGQKRYAGTHPIRGDELRGLRRLQRESQSSPFVFVSERGSPFTTAGFARMIERAATGAGWLGRRSITSTAVYTALAPNGFKDFWRD